jgi:acetyl esterase/lipase
MRVPYGPEPLQFGELTLPQGSGPHPVLVNVHGGVWLSEFTIAHSRALARALADEGFAVWNLEYRRIGNAGGAWPGTFLDVSNGLEHLRALATTYPLDLSRVGLMGHSAGGQLAMWLASRQKMPRTSELFVADPLPVCAVVALAPASQLPELYARGLFDCAVGRLMGGSPEQFPERYAAVTPALLAPSSVPQILIVGRHDEVWGWNASAYLTAARAAGDGHTRLITIESAGHFEPIAPESSAWPTVVSSARTIVS